MKMGLLYKDFISINLLTGYLLRNHYYQGQCLTQIEKFKFHFFQGVLYTATELPEI